MTCAVMSDLARHELQVDREDAEANALREYAESNLGDLIGDVLYGMAECVNDEEFLFLHEAIFKGCPKALTKMHQIMLRRVLEAAEPGFKEQCEENRAWHEEQRANDRESRDYDRAERFA